MVLSSKLADLSSITMDWLMSTVRSHEITHLAVLAEPDTGARGSRASIVWARRDLPRHRHVRRRPSGRNVLRVSVDRARGLLSRTATRSRRNGPPIKAFLDATARQAKGIPNALAGLVDNRHECGLLGYPGAFIVFFMPMEGWTQFSIYNLNIPGATALPELYILQELMDGDGPRSPLESGVSPPTL